MGVTATAEKPLTVEERADEFLREAARREGKSARQLGYIDDRRWRTVRGRELTFSGVYTGRTKDE